MEEDVEHDESMNDQTLPEYVADIFSKNGN
jgi:hypothetical protein